MKGYDTNAAASEREVAGNSDERPQIFAGSNPPCHAFRPAVNSHGEPDPWVSCGCGPFVVLAGSVLGALVCTYHTAGPWLVYII